MSNGDIPETRRELLVLDNMKREHVRMKERVAAALANVRGAQKALKEEEAAWLARIAALEAELAKAREAQRWIPVTERMPEEWTEVMVKVAGNSGVYPRHLCWNPDAGWRCGPIVAIDLPAPPKEGGAHAAATHCEWRGDGNPWYTSCGQDWGFIDGSIEDNACRFCFHCGKLIKRVRDDAGQDVAPPKEGA